MRFGIFLAPYHAKLNNPTLALERDIQLIEHLDRLGFDEAWIGEHHSGGAELITAPDLMIAAIAERTKQISLGTGVYSLGYHHPMSVAERMVLLDHLTRGRVKLGVGPGALATDAFQRGYDPRTLRQRMAESLDAIVELLRGEGPVNRDSDWFTLRDASLHLLPYTRPCFEIAVAALISPSGPSLAGTHGCSLLSIGSTLVESGVEALAAHWNVFEETSIANGHKPDRSSWRVVAPWHIAPTREQAFAEIEYGMKEWIDYEREVAYLPLARDAATAREAAEEMVAIGAAVIGTPQDAADMIDRLLEQSGGFGTFLCMTCDWADFEARKRSFALFADEVMPRYQDSTRALRESYQWGKEKKNEIVPEFNQAFQQATERYYGADHARTRKITKMLNTEEQV
jgi:limonene 1,2-monooxygenase